MVPLLASNLSPGGNPVEVHEYGGVPPVAVSVVLYATPCVASGIDGVVMESGPPPPPPPPPAGLTVMLSDTGAVVFGGLDVSVACTVKVLVPVAVGVPVIVPALADRLSPFGSEPLLDHVIGAVPPLEASVAL